MSLFKRKDTAKPAAEEVAGISPEAFASGEDIEANVQAVMEKYDRESNVRRYSGVPKAVIRYFLIFFALYSVAINLIFNWETRIERASFVGLLVVLIFLVFPAQKGQKRINYIPWYDILLGILGAIAYFYFVFNCQAIVNQGMKLNMAEIVLGGIGVLITLEACRRSVGIPIVIVASAFIIYGLTQKSLSLNVYNLFYTTEGVIGTPIRACSTFIVLFVIFGAFLEKTGISQFFIDLANSVAGGSTGGPAKVAVISSALCGMVSGSSVGNTVTTGSVTIPMMKKSGYQPEFAGAVEAAASTGGQIMPPIMGAAAFLMVEYAGYEYGYIALRAVLPAVLYFAGIFIAVHLEAKKLGLVGLPKEMLPRFGKLAAKQGFLLLPLVALVYLIMTKTMSLAAILAALLAIAVCNIKKAPLFSGLAIAGIAAYSFIEYIEKVIPVGEPGANILLMAIAACLLLSMFEKDVPMNFRGFLDALESGARSTLTVGVACATAGIIACVITTTGIGTKLITLIVGVSGGQMMIAMFLTMITCIILGMGVPTTANYVIMATTCAPILIRMGMDTLAAHMFVFYFGIVADITPPVALAAYAGSAIAGSKPMKTALNATVLAIAAFIVPYVFGLNPKLLFVDAGALEVAQITITSLIGIFGVASGLKGYSIDIMPVPLRVLSVAAGLALIDPAWFTDIFGVVVIAGITLFLKLKKIKAAPATS